MFTKIECGECGGDYRPDTPGYFLCECGHMVHTTDLELDYDECVQVRDGVLGYSPRFRLGGV